ncbi:MAG: hypothetical protein D8B59_10430 [Bacteroidetes bacterium]|jgi:hypothetical protein|nr:hypothetical protein HMPREF0156_01490 [Bacteroidetes oral taxon 274 str. F0058]RKV85026.1 MAG: hypothetical protein D8B59_10430 [Bacteroidota bacterium]
MMKKDTIKNSEIRVPHGVMKRLKDDFGCSYPFLRKVLKGMPSRDERTSMIREAAVQYGGKFIQEYEYKPGK